MRSLCQQKRPKKKQETITIQVTSFNSCTSVKARPKCGKGTPFAGLTLARVRRWTWSFSEKKLDIEIFGDAFEISMIVISVVRTDSLR